jgi:hypothetical protein
MALNHRCRGSGRIGSCSGCWHTPVGELDSWTWWLRSKSAVTVQTPDWGTAMTVGDKATSFDGRPALNRTVAALVLQHQDHLRWLTV